jgi:hypothetical protein
MAVTRSTGRPPGSGAVRRVLGLTVAARQRRVLSRIECMLARTDPRLAAKFGMFSRLTGGEEIPQIEQLTASTPRRPGTMPRFGQPPYLHLAVLCAVFAAVALVTTLLTGGGAFAHCLPAKAAQGYSLQSEGTMHPVAPAAGERLTAPWLRTSFTQGSTKRITDVSNVNDLPRQIAPRSATNRCARLAAAMVPLRSRGNEPPVTTSVERAARHAAYRR